MTLLRLWFLPIALISGVFFSSSLLYPQRNAPPAQSREPSLIELQQEFRKSEQLLLTVYDDLSSLVKALDPKKATTLEQAQMAWVTYRKQHSNILADAAETAHANWESTLYEELIRQNNNRIAELRVLYAIFEAHYQKRFPGRQFSAPSTRLTTPSPRSPQPRK
jgi:uncharacterized protein YecT (DUF1311 family)